MGRGVQRAANRRRGVRALAAASVGLIVLGLAGGPAAGQEDDFVPGSGRADARLVRLGPSAAQLSLAPTVGVALADYQTTVGRGESLIFDWVALDGSIPEGFKDETHALRADTTAGEECWDRQRFLPADPPAAVTEQHAQAGPEGPFGASEFHLRGFEVPGVFEVTGGIARAGARLEGNVRTATAVTEIAEVSLFDGAVRMVGLRWESVQRTVGDGAPEISGSFSLEAFKVLEQDVDVPEGLKAAVDGLNEALAEIGISIQLPQTSDQGGIARVTPFGINVFPSESRQQVFGPLTEGIHPIREPLIDALFALGEEIDNITGASEEGEVAEGDREVELVGCPGDPQPAPEGGSSPPPAMPFASGVLVTDISLGVLTGTGALNVLLGGTMAFTEGERFESPFGEAAPFLPPAPQIETIPGEPAVPPVPPVVVAGEDVVALPTSPVGPVGRTEPGSRGGIAVLIGAIGLAIALVTAATDWYLIRRGRAVLPTGPGGP